MDHQRPRRVQTAVPLVVQIRSPNTPPQFPSFLRARSTIAPRFLCQTHTQIMPNTTPTSPLATLIKPPEQGTPRLDSPLAVITNISISTMRRKHATALNPVPNETSRGMYTYVLFASTPVLFLSNAYTIAYGHGTPHGPTRWSSATRDPFLGSPHCYGGFSAGPSARVLHPGEFSHLRVPRSSLRRLFPPHSSIQQDARLHLERAALLHFAPPQYKLGHALDAHQSTEGSRDGHGGSCVVPRGRLTRMRHWRLRLPKRLREKGWGAPSMRWGITRRSGWVCPRTLMQLGCGTGW